MALPLDRYRSLIPRRILSLLTWQLVKNCVELVELICQMMKYGRSLQHHRLWVFAALPLVPLVLSELVERPLPLLLMPRLYADCTSAEATLAFLGLEQDPDLLHSS